MTLIAVHPRPPGLPGWVLGVACLGDATAPTAADVPPPPVAPPLPPAHAAAVAALHRWASSSAEPVACGRLVGPAGCGKRAVASCVAAALAEDGWSVAAAGLGAGVALALPAEGGLIVIEDGDHRRTAAARLEAEAARLAVPEGVRLRLLVISRWAGDPSGATRVVEVPSVIAADDAHRAFSRTRRAAASDDPDRTAPPLGRAVFRDWWALMPASWQRLDLATTAAGLPGDPDALVRTDAAAILSAAAAQRRADLVARGRAAGLADQAMVDLTVAAALAGDLDSGLLRRLAAPTIAPALPSASVIGVTLAAAGILRDGVVVEPASSLALSVLVHDELARIGPRRGALLALLVDRRPAALLDRLAALAQDLESAPAMVVPAVDGWLREALDRAPTAAATVESLLTADLPAPLRPVAVALLTDLLADGGGARSVRRRRRRLLAALHDRAGDAAAAVAVWRDALTDDPDDHDALHALATALATAADWAAALEVAETAIMVRRRAVATAPELGPGWADSLVLAARCRAALGDTSGARADAETARAILALAGLPDRPTGQAAAALIAAAGSTGPAADLRSCSPIL